jgi:glycerol-3-phosphate dehydrogenase
VIEPFDVLVIGGGVNGTGLARDLAMRGFRVCLVEKKDFASGASGANSGMIHGGIRYLRYDRKVTELASIDSGYIQKIVPHLLFRIPFLYPITARNASRPTLRERAWAYGVEVYFGTYDQYSAKKGGKPSSHLSPEELYALEPALRRNAVAGLTIDEWGIDPWRLCLLNALSAQRHGATVLPYTQFVSFVRDSSGAVTGAELRNPEGKTFAVSAKITFNCGGPWAPRIAALAGLDVRIRAGKGVHLLLDRRLTNYGVICGAVDGREIFILPWGDASLIGTTDDDYYGDPDSLRVTEDEVEYLLEGVASAVPAVRQATIMRTYAGIRPTLYEYGETEDALSREHEIYDHAAAGVPGLFTLLGGKLASFRVQAEEAANLVCRRFGRDAPCGTHLEPLPGGERFPDIRASSEQYQVPELVVERIAHRQGANTEAVLELAAREPALRAIACPCEQVIGAEMVWALRNEMVHHLTDLSRRCRVGWGPCQGSRCALEAATIYGAERRLGIEQVYRELTEFLDARFIDRRAILSGAQLAQEELGRGQHFTTGNLDGSHRS